MNFRALSKATVLSLIATFTMTTGYCNARDSINDSNDVSSEFVTSVIMAKETKGDEKVPESITNVFKPTDTIHAVVRITKAPANTKIKATWYVEDVGSAAEPDSLIESTEVTADGTRNIDFALTPTKPFPVGTYEVEISINGDVDTTKSFSVK